MISAGFVAWRERSGREIKLATHLRHPPEPEQCCALIPGYPNAARCTEPGFQGWHYCEVHIEVAGALIASGAVVTEIDDQSPIRGAR
jgi:hypothetical protein